MRWFPVLCIILVIYGIYTKYVQRPIVHPVGAITAQSDPEQTVTHASSFEYRGYTINPLADFKIKARVISAEHYLMGREAELSPVDLALGWGRMSDTAVLNKLHISQNGRFYFWRYEDQPPIPTREIISHSANMHMVPASEGIAKQLKAVKQGEIVSLTGYLIEARAKDGWYWKSSLTRNDTGAGACELIWVKAVSIIDK